MANREQLARLKRGVGEWNQWRKKDYRVEINLGEANLGEANLTGANLNEADLTGANLFGAKLFGVDLIGACLVGAYLSGTNLSGKKLIGASLIGADLSGTNLSGTNLSGTNLMGAKIMGAKIMGANLMGANLSEANLSKANLSTADALYTNFTRANLTAAYIRDWHINTESVFEGVICDYIYYKIDEKGNYQDRRPHNPDKIFNAGDFQRLIETARETVDLIFSDGIDWKAFLESFHGLQIESENRELSITGILKRRDGTFVIQIDAPQNTDKAELEKRFYEDYEQKVALIEQNYQAQLAIKDQEITHRDQELLQLYRDKSTDMTEIAKLAAARSITIEELVMSIQQTGNFASGFNFGDNNEFQFTLNEAEQQNLTEIITEVQAIIAPLAQTYPNNPTTQGIKAIEAIEKNPNLKQKLIEAAKKGGLAAFKKSFDNPIGAFIGTAIEVWMGK